MKAVYVDYARTKTETGTYNNQSSGIRIEVEDGDKVKDVIAAAKAFVAQSLGEQLPFDEYEKAKRVITDFESAQADIPF